MTAEWIGLSEWVLENLKGSYFMPMSYTVVQILIGEYTAKFEAIISSYFSIQ